MSKSRTWRIFSLALVLLLVLVALGTALPLPAKAVQPIATHGNLYADPCKINANGISTTTLYARFWDQFWSFMPDGTDVVFTTDYGTVGSSTVTKQISGGSGLATATLTSVASNELVIASVVATCQNSKKTTAVFLMPPGHPDILVWDTGLLQNSDSMFFWYGMANLQGQGDHILTLALFDGNPAGAPNNFDPIQLTFGGHTASDQPQINIGALGHDHAFFDMRMGPQVGIQEDAFFDVHLDNASGVQQLVLMSFGCLDGVIGNRKPVTWSHSVAYANGFEDMFPDLPLIVAYWWTGSQWAEISNQEYSNGCMTLTFTASTSPRLSQLTGTYFSLGIPKGVKPPSQADDSSYGESHSTTLRAPNMKLRYLKVTPQQAYVNQPVTITTNVINDGGEGSYNVMLRVNNRVEQTQMVKVGDGATKQVKFTVTKSQPGTYSVAIGNEKSVLNVVSGGDNVAQHAPVNGGVIAAVIFGVLLLVTVIVLMLAFRRPA